ncbi:MAG TPA: cation diffusion facilitator family transporter [Firmicutes bacterium]|nr:cation diffusion facilitator family transporter [Bacillota bacterium]
MNLRILSLFVRDYENTGDPRVRERCASAAGIVGIASNIFLSIIKVIIGIVTKSIAITADAVNNLTDAGSSIITLIGFRLASKPADAKHPYGHRRIEYITGLIVSMVITILGVQFFLNSVESLFSEPETTYTPVTFAILAVSIVIKLWQNRFYVAVGRHIDSATLIATASDSRNDVLTTSAVLVGAIISKLTKLNLDGWLGCAVALFIIYSGVSLIIETSNPLLGLAPSSEFIKSIGDRIMSYEGILGYHDLVVHNYGPGRCFASVHAEVPAERDILESHDIIDNIEFDFLRETGIHLVIHLDPVVTGNPEVSRLHEEVDLIIKEISSEIHCELTMHDFRVVKRQTHTNLLFDITVPLDSKLSDSALRELIEAKIKRLSPSYNAVITCDRSYVSTTE